MLKIFFKLLAAIYCGQNYNFNYRPMDYSDLLERRHCYYDCLGLPYGELPEDLLEDVVLAPAVSAPSVLCATLPLASESCSEEPSGR